MRFVVFIIGLAAMALASTSAVALNIQHYRPSTEGLGYLRLDSAATLPASHFSFGVAQNLSYKSLEIGRSSGGATTNG